MVLQNLKKILKKHKTPEKWTPDKRNLMQSGRKTDENYLRQRGVL